MTEVHRHVREDWVDLLTTKWRFALNKRNKQLEASWLVMAHAQKPDFVSGRKGRVHLNRRRCHFSRLLAAEVCALAVVMLDTPSSEVVWRVLSTNSIRQFPLHFPSRTSCAITFQLESTCETNNMQPQNEWTPRIQGCDLTLHPFPLTTTVHFFYDRLWSAVQSECMETGRMTG